MSWSVLLHESRSLYEIVGVDSEASSADIKRAYRKKALKLHPDKNPSEEARHEFLKLQSAYEILANDRARSAYDRFGLQAAILVMDPQAGAGQVDVASMLGGLSLFARCSAILALTLVFALLLTVPVFFSLRVDGTVDWDWGVVFTPLWVWEGLLCLCFAYLAVSGSKGGDSGVQLEMLYFMYTTLSFAALPAFIALKLGGSVAWSWWIVLLPWVQWEAVALIRALYTSREDFINTLLYLHHGGQLDEEEQLRSASFLTRPEYYLFVVRRVLFGVCRLLLALLIAAKLEGRFDGDWWATFAPIWAAVAMLALCSVLDALGVTGMEPRRPETMTEEEWESMKGRMKIGGVVATVLCVAGPLVAVVALIAAKAESATFTALLIFTPIIVLAACLWCIFSCVLCCVPSKGTAEGDYGAGFTPSGATPSGTGGQPARPPSARESSAAYQRAEEGRMGTAGAAGDDGSIGDID